MSEQVEKVTIPEKHVEFCRAVARLCKEHGITKFGGNYRPETFDPWDGDISFSWEQGRHGEDSNKLFVSSQVRALMQLDGKKP